MLVECYDKKGAEVYEIIIKQIFQDLVLGPSVDDLKAYVNPDDPVFVLAIKMKKTSNAIAFEEQGLIALPDLGRNDARMMILIIAHELRHIWQNVYHPELQVDYVHVESDDDLEAYSLHPCEVDAEAYALSLAEIVWNIDPLVGGNSKVLAALLKRRKEIKVSLEDGARAYMEILGELTAT